MKSQRYNIRRLFSLILAVSVLMSGFVPSGHSRSRRLTPSSVAPHPRPTQDRGDIWKPVNTGLGSLDVAALAIDPINTANIYAGTRGGGMFKSTNGGATWSKLGINNRYIEAIAVNFLNPNIIHAGSGDGGWCNSTFPIFKSTDGGASWSNTNSPADCGGISLLVIDPTSPNTLYAGSLGQYLSSGSIQLWKTTDGGATWRVVFFGNPGLSPFVLAVNPANPQNLYASGDLYGGNTPFPSVIESGLYKSTDGGSNWSATGLTKTGPNYTNINAVVIDPLNPSTLYAGSTNNGMLKSTDGGANWSAINNGLTNTSTITAIVVDRDNPNILYIGTNGRVFKSTDGGASWSAFNDGLTNLEIRVLTLAPGNPNTLYAGTPGGVFKITDNTPATTPIDDARFFVHQHYLDFLSREPDPAGIDFWSRQITDCAGDQQCVEIKRINVSAAFFLSIEFQQTGYLVYKAYGAAFGTRRVGNAVPLTLQEFLPDTQRIGNGVVVNQGDWQALLEANKVAYFNEFVSRQQFLTLYPSSMGAAQFVDALNANSNGSLSQAQRDDLVNKLGAGQLNRAQVLRAVAENEAFDAAEKNRAFVVMQYFGYLRRNPNDAPEPSLDLSGYNFWLSKLNNHYGDFIAAEMVHSFLVSGEYRGRFGQ